MKSPIASDTSALKRNPNYRPVFFDSWHKWVKADKRESKG